MQHIHTRNLLSTRNLIRFYTYDLSRITLDIAPTRYASFLIVVKLKKKY